MTVLVVEATPVIGNVLEGMLTRSGHSVARATDIDGALAFLRDHEEIELVLTAERLAHGASGLELVQRLRSELHSAIPVILTSISADSASVAAAQAACCDDFLVKPLTVKLLADRVDRWIRPG